MSDQRDNPAPAGYTVGNWIFMLGFLVIAVAIPAVVVKIHLLGEALAFQWSLQTIGGIVAAVLALALVAYNLHFCFIHPWLHRRRFGTMDGFQYVSSAPAVSGFLVFFAALLLAANPVVGVVLLLLYFLDPGGIHVFVFSFLRELMGWHASPNEPSSDH